MDKQASLVFEADIPAHMRRGCAATMMVVLTESQSSTISQVSVEDSKQSESQSSSSNTLQVPDYAYQAECFDEPRRRSLSSLQTEETTFRNSRQDRRASAPPVRRASCVWGQIWDLRDLLSRKRKFSASSSDYQVRPTKILFSFYIVLMNLFGDLCQFSKLRKLLFVIVGRIAKLVLHQPSVSASCVWGQIWDLRECFGEPHGNHCQVSRLRKLLSKIAGRIAEQVLHQSDVPLVFGVRFGTCMTYSREAQVLRFIFRLSRSPIKNLFSFYIINIRLYLSGPIQSDQMYIADQMILPLGWEHSHGKTQYIPGKQVLVRS